MKKLSFSSVKFSELARIVDLTPCNDDTVFDEWFGYEYPIQPDECRFLQTLIDDNRLYMGSYSEEELKIRFIGPLLNTVNYRCGQTRDWYQRPLKAQINRVTVGGYVDFMVAR